MAPQMRNTNSRRVTSSSRAVEVTRSVEFFKWAGISLLGTVVGPLFLIYLTLRCEKNQCVLFQLPLVVPLHASAYFSTLSVVVVLSFISSMLVINLVARPIKLSRTKVGHDLPPIGLMTLIVFGSLLVGLAYLRPDYLEVLFSHYLRILVATTVFCYVFTIVLMLLNVLKVLPKRSVENTWLSAFFWGTHTQLYVNNVELKSFFYINVGLVAWGLLDLLIAVHFLTWNSLTGPLAFLTASQLLVIAHILFHEQSLYEKPFRETEALGFYWIMRVLLYQPFFHSLPVLYASMTEVTLAKPLLLSNIVLFFFGFIVYLSSLHQRNSFNADPASHKNLQAISASGKRLLISGYWSVVQKPDYLGYIIMWLSWTLACGFSGMALLVLLVICVSILAWQLQLQEYNKKKLGIGWVRYLSAVPYKIIPYVY